LTPELLRQALETVRGQDVEQWLEEHLGLPRRRKASRVDCGWSPQREGGPRTSMNNYAQNWIRLGSLAPNSLSWTLHHRPTGTTLPRIDREGERSNPTVSREGRLPAKEANGTAGRDEGGSERRSVVDRIEGKSSTDNIPSPRKRLTSLRCSVTREPWPTDSGRQITEARPHPRSVAPAKNYLGEMDHPRLLCATEQVAPSALPSRFRPVDPRERGGNDGAVSQQSQWCGCLSLSD